ncbi:MAG: ATP-binding protein [Acidobacteria bacterium]|nr:MAG: ATP-binding protein [Acidobacteriota bacterium]
MERLCFTLTNRLDEIAGLTRRTAAFLESHQVDVDAAFAIDLALEEMVSNVIRHGYKNEDSQQICVRLEVGSDQIVLVIEDCGPPFNPLDLPEPDLDRPIDQRPIGGLGIFLVRKTVDRMDYERREDRNILQITVARHDG